MMYSWAAAKPQPPVAFAVQVCHLSGACATPVGEAPASCCLCRTSLPSLRCLCHAGHDRVEVESDLSHLSGQLVCNLHKVLQVQVVHNDLRRGLQGLGGDEEVGLSHDDPVGVRH